jgi:RNA polymerase sigma factor (sigma-70 family)
MPTERFDTFLRQLRRAALRRDGCPDDGDLLERYVRLGDEAAFEALVRQHGAMVLGVCRRVLHNWHDAEEAFQATFLVLARRAASVRPRDRVGNFLYGVAYRTALEARRAGARRRLKEARVVPRTEEPADGPWAELRPVLDLELAGLPEKYRAPVVLCDLEGKTRREAARQLGWREGTLAGRLARARVLLARRLSKHGVAVAGGALAALLCRQAAAEVPRPLVWSTVKAAARVAAGQAAALPANLAALVEGVNRAMWLSKLKVAILGLLVVGAVGGAGLLSYPRRGTAEGEPARVSPLAPAARASEPPPIPPAPTLPPYVIRQPDVLLVQITQTPDLPLELQRECPVRPDGTLALGDLGTVPVAGKTIEEVRTAIAGVLKERVPTGRLTDEQIRRQVRVDVTAKSATRTRQYQVECMLIEAADDGQDFGKDGKGKLLSRPTLFIREGEEGRILSGGQLTVPGERDGAVEYLEYGTSLRVKVNRLAGGKVRVEAVVERSEPEQTDSSVRIRTVSVRSVDRVKLGERVKVVLDKDADKPRLWGVLRVVAEKDVWERFYGGGFHGTRGFAFRGVGPDSNGCRLGGDFLLLKSLEYQVPVKANDQVYVVPFLDGGTVEDKVEIKHHRVSAGVGLRFVVPTLGPVPIALDFGFPIARGPVPL